MRLSRILLDAWGHYRRQATLTLPGGAPDLHVILGANEAGKSTLLSALESLLFGIEKRVPHGHQHGDGALALSGEGTLADGTPLVWTRRKKGETFTGALGARALDEAGLRAALGGVDRVRWRGLFGFSDVQLARAAEALVDVPLSQVAAGEADPREAREALAKVAAGLYSRSKNARNPRANLAATDLERLRREAEALAVLPAAWHELEAREATTAAALVAAQGRSEAARGALARATAQRDAWEPLRHAAEAKARLTRLAVPAGLGRNAQVEHEGRLALRGERLRARDQLAAELERLVAEQSRRVVRDDVLAVAPRIEALAETRAMWEDNVARLPADEEALAQEERWITAESADLLGEGAGAEALLGVRTDSATREAARALADEATALGRARERAASDARDLERRARDLELALGDLPPEEDARLLDAALQAAVALDPLRAEHRAKAERLAEAEREEATLTARLSAVLPVGGGVPDPALLPGDATLTAEEDTRVALVRRADEATARAQRAREEAHQLALQIAGTDAGGELPTEAGLAERRRARGEGWAAIRRAWLGGEARSGLDAAALAQRFEGQVEESDRYADARFVAAERLSTRAALEARQAQAEQWVTRCGADEAAATAAVDAWRQAWAARWSAVGLPALGSRLPAEARASLRDVEAWLAVRERAASMRERLGQVAAQLDAGDDTLRAALESAGVAAGGGAEPARGPTGGLPTAPAARIALARDRVTRAREAASTRSRLREEARRLEVDRAAHQRDRAALAERAAELDERWARLRSTIGATDLAPGGATAWLERARAVQGRIARAQRDRRTLAERRRAAAEWSAEVADTLAPLLGAPPTTNPGALCDTATRALAEARRAQARDVELGRLIPETRAKLDRATRALDEVESELARARALAGAPDDAVFLERAAAAVLASELNETLERIDARVQVLRAGEPVESFDLVVAATPFEVLEAAVVAARAEVVDADRAREEATRAHHEARLARLAVDGSARAAALRQEAEGKRRELRERVEEWLVHTLAVRLLDDATRRFEREREPDVLARTSEWLRALTQGRYVEVRTLGAAHELSAVRASGEALVPAELSDGTRQQLYLAARLAWAERHNEESEPLPIVLDDALAAFDDARARAAIEVLATMAGKTQVLLLTHHTHVVRLAREVLPELRALRLGEDGGTREA